MTTLDSSAQHHSKPPIWNTVLRYGGICGLAMVVFSLLSYLMGVDMASMSTGIINFVVAVGITVGVSVMAIRHQRDTLEGGFMTYGRALLIGALTTAVGVVISSIWNYILVTIIDPDYVTRLKESFMEQWSGNMPEEALEQAAANFDEMGDLSTALTNGFIAAAVIGLIAGLIAAAFGMKNRPLE
ncbi:MAG: DUF4199 domain-containing protein [Lewinellaceae bacterium]|nr:DUF4199 domain-containing protein [Lewinellaceae bacterium]